MTLRDEAARKIDEKSEQADEIQKMFNEWILENREDLFRDFIDKPKVQKELKQIQR